MPWVKRPPHSYGLKGRENLNEIGKISRDLSGRYH